MYRFFLSIAARVARNISAAVLLGAAVLLVTSGMQVRAAELDVSGGVVAQCPATGPGIAVCATAAVVLHELVQMANGKEGFNRNGEIMKVLAVPVKIVDGNIKGAARERGELDKVIRAVTGVSVRDIDQYGIWGGDGSFFRKPLG